jgi:hypothetical protein
MHAATATIDHERRLGRRAKLFVRDMPYQRPEDSILSRERRPPELSATSTPRFGPAPPSLQDTFKRSLASKCYCTQASQLPCPTRRFISRSNSPQRIACWIETPDALG